jgi:hypothetical protein
MINADNNGAHRSISYRPDIDGLRAIAVSAVVVFHLFPGRVPGGFVGVDVFFVISGFLISSIIMREIDRGIFSYWDFYARRIRRIFPALILVLLATMAMGWWFFLPDENVLLGKEIMAGSLFFYNFLLLKDVGYFDAVYAQKPLLHLWSLGVEEQFYIVWPVLVALIWRFSNRRFGVVAGVAFASFILNIALVAHYPTATFYLPFTRFWELLVGAMLAMAALQGDVIELVFGKMVASSKHINWIRNATSVLGFTLVSGSIVVLTDGLAYPGWLAIAPTLGAALLISAGSVAWINQHILSIRPVVFVGLISYPLYLWHWPALLWSAKITRYLEPSVMTFRFSEMARLVGLENSTEIAAWLVLRGVKSFALLAAVILAIATYLLVEKWVRRPVNLQKKAWGLLSALVLILPIGTLLQITVMEQRMGGEGRSQFLKKYDMQSPESAYRQATVAAYRPECNFYGGRGDVKPVLAPSCYTASAKPVVMLWGDSHAMHLRSGLDAIQRKQMTYGKQLEVLQITSGSCHASLEQNTLKTDEARGCNLANSLALKAIAQVKPDVVIIAQALGHTATNWSQLLTEVLRLGARHVIVVGPVPQWQNTLPRLIAYNYWPKAPVRLQSHLQQEFFEVDKQLKRQIINGPMISYVSAIDFFCDQSNACLVSIGADQSVLTSYDSGHLTPEASVAFVEARLEPFILGITF